MFKLTFLVKGPWFSKTVESFVIFVNIHAIRVDWNSETAGSGVVRVRRRFGVDLPLF